MFGRKKNKDERREKKRHKPGMTQAEITKLEEVGIRRGFFSKKSGSKKDEPIQKRDISRPLSLYAPGETSSEQPAPSVLQRATIYGDVVQAQPPRRASSGTPPSSPPISPPPTLPHPLTKQNTEGNMKFPVPPYRRRISGQLNAQPYDSPRNPAVPDGYSVPRKAELAEATRPVVFAPPAVKPKPKPRNRRIVTLKKREAGDFGVSLRRSAVIEMIDGQEVTRTVYFAEPGASMQASDAGEESSTRLFPGDRLIEIDGINVEIATRDEIISRIRNAGNSVKLVVQGDLDAGEEKDGAYSIPRPKQASMKKAKHVKAKDDTSPKLPAVKKRSIDHAETNGVDQMVDVDTLPGVIWKTKEKVWLKHQDGISSAHLITADTSSGEPSPPVLPDGKCWIELELTKRIVMVPEEDVDLANEAEFDRAGDVASLRHLNESCILHTLSCRYEGGLVHTFAGPHLITIAQDQSNPSNYTSQVKSTYKGSRFGDTPPHVYAIVQHAHQNMMSSNSDQCIISIGHTNAGKTNNIRHMISYYASISSATNAPTVEKVNCAMDILSSFTTATTHQCKAATRCVHIYSVDFDRTGQMAALSVQALLLERSRVVYKAEDETNFHVFYQLLYGADPQLRRELFLLDLEQAENPLIIFDEKSDPNFQQNALKGFAHLQKAFEVLGLSTEERKSVFLILAALLHLGMAGVQKVNGGRHQFAKADSAQKAASLLGVPPERLAKAIFQPTSGKKHRSMSSASLKRSSSLSSHSLQAIPQIEDLKQSGEQQLNSFITTLYIEVFRSVVSYINRSLSSSHRSQHTILLVDTPGYQGSSGVKEGQRGASYSDLTYNYVQDRLHAHYHSHAFTSHRDRYLQEDIDCDITVPDCDFTHSIDVVGQPPSVGGKGLLWLLDEEAGSQGASDETFVDRLLLQNQQQPKQFRGIVQRSERSAHIHIQHQGGLHSVEYDTTGWLNHARYNSTGSTATAALQESKKKYISEMFGGTAGERLHGSISGLKLDGGNSSIKRSPSFKKSWNVSTGAVAVKKSLCLLTKFQTDGLVDMLRRTQPHFILAVAPSEPNEPRGTPNIPLIRRQLQGFQLVDVARMHKQGYPEHMVFYEFRRHFDVLLRQLSANLPSNSTTVALLDDKEATENIIKQVELERSQYRIGNTQVFFRSGSLNAMQDRRNAKVGDVIIAFQAHCRGYLARKRLERKKVQVVAVRCIQRNVRLFMAIRQWPWWRLLTKVLPLVEVTRTEEELREKEAEIEILKEKYDKVLADRNDLQAATTMLDKKLCDALLHLEEEQATAAHATEVLEVETKERIKLEKIVKESQSSHQHLLKKVEEMEVELAEKRLLYADHTTHIDSDEELEDGEYKAKYERAVREFQFEMKKKVQSFEDNVEEMEADKKALDRKIMQLNEEVEDRDRVDQQNRKKLQRLNAQLSDTKIHLEETLAKNHELEKKQRKFDSELYAVQADVTALKTSRDRIQREKDKILLENNSLEKELDEKNDDVDNLRDKIKRLENDLEDNNSRDSDDRQLVNGLRKKIRELEGKMQEQEEELEEQASTIHTLEQTKERLEMSSEQARNQRQREVEGKDEEMEEMRTSYQKRIKNVEMQLEEAEEERAATSKQRRDLEMEVEELRRSTNIGHDVELEKRLRKDLKRYKALLADAQTMIDHLKVDAVSKQQTRQLKAQLEDSQYACAAAVKSRKAIELEQEDLQAQLEEISKGKQDAESRTSILKREVHELRSKIEEDEEDNQETLRKYKSLVSQQTEDRRLLVEAQGTIEELKQDKAANEDKIVALQSQIEFMEGSTVDNATASRLEAKAKDFETKLEFQKTTCRRLEVQLSRAKENLDKITAERDAHIASEHREKEAMKRVQRQLRESKTEQGELLKREQDALQKKHDLEMELSDHQNQIESLQADLKLAFKRISNLQIAFEELDESDMGEESMSSSDEEDLRTSRTSWRSRTASARPRTSSSVLSSRNEDESKFSDSSVSTVQSFRTSSAGNTEPEKLIVTETLEDCVSEYARKLATSVASKRSRRKKLSSRASSASQSTNISTETPKEGMDRISKSLADEDPSMILYGKPSNIAMNLGLGKAKSFQDLNESLRAVKLRQNLPEGRREQLQVDDKIKSDIRRMKTKRMLPDRCSSAIDFMEDSEEEEEDSHHDPPTKCRTSFSDVDEIFYEQNHFQQKKKPIRSRSRTSFQHPGGHKEKVNTPVKNLQKTNPPVKTAQKPFKSRFLSKVRNQSINQRNQEEEYSDEDFDEEISQFTSKKPPLFSNRDHYDDYDSDESVSSIKRGHGFSEMDDYDDAISCDDSYMDDDVSLARYGVVQSPTSMVSGGSYGDEIKSTNQKARKIQQRPTSRMNAQNSRALERKQNSANQRSMSRNGRAANRDQNSVMREARAVNRNRCASEREDYSNPQAVNRIARSSSRNSRAVVSQARSLSRNGRAMSRNEASRQTRSMSTNRIQQQQYEEEDFDDDENEEIYEDGGDINLDSIISKYLYRK
uniref:unconventional myosin-XVIIIa isoform X2 n=1 Tax=Ciona intestinalis TaxID=7719 RepID=UPI000EF528B6|nr:unconventional myosin-XVIIIa isoform X2 [Ciona intestinalis]|eukprot:XP_026692375.1 unconventional myosin-XVIIIa isoform X2 [Ciona intestinalis]